MSSPHPPNPPQNHHFLPRFYLKGFASLSDPAKIWVYERRLPFQALSRLPRNPNLTAIKKAAMQPSFYACRRENGQVDYQTYENALAQRENEAARLFHLVRQGQTPSEAQKLTLARFILQMHYRVPAHQNLFPQIWQGVLTDFLVDSPLLRGLQHVQSTTPTHNKRKHALIEERIAQYHALLNQKLQEMPPDDMRLDSLINQRPLPAEMLAEMSWHLFQAPDNAAFIASDDPVFLRLGLEHAHSEVIFPFHAKLALVAAWSFQSSVGWHEASHGLVNQINHVLMELAVRNIYFWRDSPLMAQQFNQTPHVPFSLAPSPA